MNLSFDVPLGGSLAASCCFLEHLRTPIGVSWGHHGSLLSRLRASFEAFPDVQDAHTGTMLNVYVSIKCIKRCWLLEVILTGLLGMFWAIGKPFEPCPSAPGPSSSPLGSLLGRLPGITVRLGGLLHRLHALHDVPSFPVPSMTSQEGPQTAQDGANTAQEAPRTAQERSNRIPKRASRAPKQ